MGNTLVDALIGKITEEAARKPFLDACKEAAADSVMQAAKWQKRVEVSAKLVAVLEAVPDVVAAINEYYTA